MAQKKFMYLMLAMIGVISIFGCKKNKPESFQKGPVKIGVIYPFTGPNASTGEDLRAGVELATEIVNRSLFEFIPRSKHQGIQI